MKLDDKTISGLGRQQLIEEIAKLLNSINRQATSLAERNARLRQLLERTIRELSTDRPDPDGHLLEAIRAALKENR